MTESVDETRRSSCTKEDEEPANCNVHNIFLRGVPSTKEEPQFELPDSQYVYNSVGAALVIAMSEVAAKRPLDPIEYIAERLKNYEVTRQYCAGRDAEFEALRRARQLRREEEARKKAVEEEMRRQKEQEEQKRVEELERKRRSVPIETFVLPNQETRDKSGSTPLHNAVKSCNVETFLNHLHDGHSFCARDGQGQTVRDVANANKNEAIVKEIDSMIISWIKDDKVDYLKWLVAAGFGGSFPSLKKAFGPKLKGMPEKSRQIVDSIPQFESRYRELWKLSSKGTKEHLSHHCDQIKDQHPEDIYSRNQDNLSAIHMALLSKNQDTVRYLVDNFPKVVQLADGYGRLPLHYAHGAGQEFVEIVRTQGNSDEIKDAFGFTPSVYARRYELLPEAPHFESPDLVVTGEEEEEADAAEEEPVEPPAKEEQPQDASKLTPINEDEAEDN